MTRPSASRALMVVVALLLATQWLLFAAYVRREIAPEYATNFDQGTYLLLAYQTWEDVRQHGLTAGLASGVRRSPPNGALLQLEAVLLFRVGGASRLTALSVNWLHFAVLQAAVVWALWTTSRRRELALLGLGLLLSAYTPFSWAGGLGDFRPDFIAFCLYGTFLAVVFRSGVFRRHGWSIAAGAVGALCVLSRLLTAVYLGGLLGLCFVVLAFRWWHEREPARRSDRRRQATGLALCCATLCLTALPAVAAQRDLLWAYYVAGPVLGKERAVWSMAGGPGSADPWFYLHSLLAHHGGRLFGILVAGTLLSLLVARSWAHRRVERGAIETPGPGAPSGAGWFMAGALFLPLTALTLYPSRSQVVGGLLVGPLLWLILAAFARLAPLAPPGVLRILAVSALTAGLAWQASRLAGPAPRSLPVETVREVLRLQDELLDRSAARGRAPTLVLADRQRDFVFALPVSAYERRGPLLTVERAFPGAVLRPSPGEAMETLRRSHLVLLTRPASRPAPLFLPYDAGMAELYPRLLAYCKRKLVRVGTYRVPDEVMLFARDDRGLQTSTVTP